MKSHVSSQLELMQCIYRDACIKCAAVQPSLRDEMTISSRVKDEGLSFLTITLPQFGKDFERSLADGVIDTAAFRSFRKVGAIPAFLQGMLCHVFNRVTGRILDESILDISCVEGIRQIAYAFKKLKNDCTRSRVRSALKAFIQTEADLKEASVAPEDRARFERVSAVLWDSLSSIDVRLCVPKHGPGATAEGINGNQKYLWQYWYDRLEPYFPILDNAYSIGAYQSKELENVTIVAEEHELPVKITPVPKTQKGPRIIAIEPCCMQYAQQGIRSALYEHIEQHPLTSGHVNFTNQEINRKLAMMSSSDGLMATLDLSDASDRVLHDLAICMFNSNPDLRDAIVACRSTSAKMPDGQVIGPLAKFASMGSALCFPVESMYFYTICVATLLEEHNLPVTFRNVYKASREVYVYGDDIIVPSKHAATIADHLQKYYCKVNMSKSFWTGKFRESCGMDAYDGHDVSVTYVRSNRPSSRRQASDVISWVKTANLFSLRGYHLTSSHMFEVCEKMLGRLPNVDERSSMLGRVRPSWVFNDNAKRRWNPNLHTEEVFGWTVTPVYRTDELGGHGAFMKSILNQMRRKDDIIHPPAIDSKHLQRSARHGIATLKRRWLSV